MMNTTKDKLRESLRIIWAITAKDIADAVKNRITLSTILMVLFMIVFYRYLPALQNGDIPPRLAVYDVGSSRLVAELENNTQFDLVETSSQQGMERYLGDKDIVVLGLVLPADFDQALESGERVELDGHVVHWATDAAATEVKEFFEGQLTELTGKPVRIHVAGNIVYTQEDSRGFAFLASMSVIFVITMVGVSVVPHLMIEEKRAKTLDALLVSPASTGQVVIAKALTGLFYCLTASAVVLAFNTALIAHWGLAILAAGCGSLFTIALGLLLGSVIETRQQFALWAWILILPLLLPVFLSIMDDILPAGVITVMRWIPTVALSRALRVSFSNSAPLAQFGPELALVAGCAVPIFAAVAWVVRRSDQ